MRKLQKAAVAAILAAGILGVPTMAQAGSNLCEGARACIYVDPAYVGLLGWKSGGSALSNVSGSADNKTSSWENKTSRNGAWFEGTNATGKCWNMGAGKEVGSIGWPNYDKLTSWRVNGGC